MDLIRSKSVDLVISDLEMPIMNGLELCELVKSHESYKHIYFIMLSTVNDIGTKVKGLTQGADDYIIKKTAEQEVLARVRAGMRVRHLQNELKQTYMRTYENEKLASVGQLAAGVAHEINNPLGFVTSNLSSMANYVKHLKSFVENVKGLVPAETKKEMASLLKKNKVDYILDDAGDLIGESLVGARRVSEIVRALMNFSNVERPQAMPFQVNQGLEDTLRIAQSRIAGIADIELELADLPEILCFPQQLNQVFLNVLLNALQAIEKKGQGRGRIAIKSWEEDDFIFVQFSDNGSGVRQENLNKIFNPFFTTRDVGEGAGLGLSVALQMVKKHNGGIDVSSDEGRGCDVTIRLHSAIDASG